MNNKPILKSPNKPIPNPRPTATSTNLQITDQQPSHPKTLNHFPLSKLRVDLKRQEVPKDIKVRCTSVPEL